MKSTVFRDVKPCSLVNAFRRNVLSLILCIIYSSADVTERASSHSPVERERPVAVRPFPSLKRRPNFKIRKSLERTKIWSWAPTGLETKNDCADEDQQQFTGLETTVQQT
jgi:hypothetical protein